MVDIGPKTLSIHPAKGSLAVDVTKKKH